MTFTVDPKAQEELGKNLRQIREGKHLLQEEVANSVGISATYYAGIERGEDNPTFAVLQGLCKTLKVKSSEFLPF